jgi:putative DNA primase/helicase
MEKNDNYNSREEVDRYLTALYGNGEVDGVRIIWTKPDSKTYSYDMNEKGNMVDQIPELAKEKDVYLGICLQKERPSLTQRGGAEGTITLPGVWMDIDIQGDAHKQTALPATVEAACEFLQSLPLQPTMVVSTGGGIHVYWLFKEVWTFNNDEDRRRAMALSRRFQEYVIAKAREHGYELDNTSDLARVLRVPGTFNRKAEPAPVRILEHKEENRYTPEEIESLFPVTQGSETLVMAKPTPVGIMIPSGQRNVMLTSLAGNMLQAGMTEDVITLQLRQINTLSCNPSLPESEVLQILKSVLAYSKGPTPLTDVGNGERLIEKFGKDLRYCHHYQSYLVWDGNRFRIDDQGKVFELAKETIRDITTEAAANTLMPGDIKKALMRHAAQSEQYSRIRAMVSLAQSDRRITVVLDQLDANRHYLNCLNGTLDLGSGKLLPHEKKHLITKIIPVAYDPKAQCPLFLGFLNRILGGNAELIAYLQRAFGYTLSGETKEQCLFVLYGTGANGKSTLLETIRRMMGDYARNADFRTFMFQLNTTIRNDLARLVGARLVTATEVEEGMRLSEVLVKQVTGGEPLTVRLLYRECFEYYPEFKVFIGANHKPVIKGADHGIWRRIRLIPFNVTLDKDHIDKDLPEKLHSELPGILTWAVKGCQDWMAHGLTEPEAVKRATETYHEDMDDLADFIGEMCEISPQASAGTKTFYDQYRQWCQVNKLDALGKKEFGAKLEAKGHGKTKAKGGNYFFSGIKLKGVGNQNKIPVKPSTNLS